MNKKKGILHSNVLYTIIAIIIGFIIGKFNKFGDSDEKWKEDK